MRGYRGGSFPGTGKSCGAPTPFPPRASRARKPGANYIEYGGGATWLSGTYDPELEYAVLDDRQSLAGFLSRRAARRQSLSCSLLALDGEHRKDEMVLPIHAARHTRLGRARPGRCWRRFPGKASRARCAARQSQRIFLRARSRDGKVSARHAPRRQARLGYRHRREGPADSSARQGPDAERQSRLPRRARRHQLDVAIFQSGHRPDLHRDARAVRHLHQLFEGARAEEEFLRRRRGAEAGRGGAVLPAGFRSQERASASGSIR